MHEIRMGLIGFGSWPQQAYAPLLREISDVRVAWVAANSEKTFNLARKTFGDGIVTTCDYRQLIDASDVDALMIALPNALHGEVLQAAAESSKHIFFEPPVAPDPEPAKQVLEALRQCTGIVQADLELRCLPVLEAIHARISRGILGSPRMAKIRLWCDWGYPGGLWSEEVQRQSIFHWLGHWYLDVLDVIFSRAVTRAHVLGGHASNGSLMDHGWASLEYPGGLLGQFEFNLTLPQGTVIELDLSCTGGELRADLKTGKWKWRGVAGNWQHEHTPASTPVCGFEGMRESINGFVVAVRTGQQSCAGLDVAERVQQSAQICADAECI